MIELSKQQIVSNLATDCQQPTIHKREGYIALNASRRGNKGKVMCVPLSQYDALISQPWLHQMIEGIRQGNDALKRELPFRCIHYSRFLEGKRRQDCIDPTSFLFQTCVDIDEKELVDTALGMAKLLDTQAFFERKDADGKSVIRMENPWKGQLLHLEYSARKKLHIDIRMPIGMTIEEAQRSYCEALGVSCDESCFSPERIIFITDKSSEIYRSPHWYEPLPEEEVKLRREAFLKRGLSIDGRGMPQSSHSSHNSDINLSKPSDSKIDINSMKTDKTVANFTFSGENCENGTSCENVKSVGESQEEASMCMKASEKNVIAFDLFREQAGLKEVNIDTVGSRHSSLLAIMSAGASRVMSEDELRRVVALRMPSFAGEHDCQQLIHDFYVKYCDGTKPFSRDVIRINAEAEKQATSKFYSGNGYGGYETTKNRWEASKTGGAGAASYSLESDADAHDEDALPPEMPKKLPRLVKLLLSKTPDIYKPAVACAIFPPLATHLWHTTFRYIDNVDHEATLMCALLAGTGAGKNCVQMPINLIMADIRKRDQENLAREKAWKDEMLRKGANKDKRKRPDGLVIQEIDADMTNPAFVMRTAEAQEHFLYTSLNEIDQFDALRGQGNQQFKIMCLAFDPGNIYGQTRVGLQSITERVCIRFNWNASTTIHKGQKYFGTVLTDGPVSRINFCTIPEREIGAEMPIYGTYDEGFKEELKPFIDNLCKATGRIECIEAYQLALKLKEENADFARMTQSRVFENLSFRANVIAYLKACVLYVANGLEWEPEMEDFIRWSEQYDLWCKMHFFGDAIAKSELEGAKSNKRGPKNLLMLLPDDFTINDAISLRLANGLDRKGTRIMLNTWTHRGYIRRKGKWQEGNAAKGSNDNYSNDSFEKLKYRRDGSVFTTIE